MSLHLLTIASVHLTMALANGARYVECCHDNQDLIQTKSRETDAAVCSWSTV